MIVGGDVHDVFVLLQPNLNSFIDHFSVIVVGVGQVKQ